ncbi:U-box domain-containing protein 33 isoform X1 [Carica papaya]|uniref:U-box domain-containing protein 33 isoform X1 n=3 Tax=Carica papaya TaxID=3649 RepID=UPI000B8D1655|nr:U-box domain-containing protein 33 isoform X1 [Carica papaya]
MAVVSPVPAIAQGVDSMRFLGARTPRIMASRRELVAESVAEIIEERIFVAVGKNVEKSESTLLWALRNSGGKRICIVHVHRPAQRIPLTNLGTKFPASSLKEQVVRAYREIERQNMDEILEEYLRICRQVGVRAEKLYTELDSVENGILELISQHGIKKLVMGAAADKQYSRKMTYLKSKKAISVLKEAPASCHIWFICKGHLIYTRQSNLYGTDLEVAPSSLPAYPNTEFSNHLRSQSVKLQQNHRVKLSNQAQDLLFRIRSIVLDRHGGRYATLTSPGAGGLSTPRSRSDAEGSSDKGDHFRRSLSGGFGRLLCSSSGMALNLIERSEEIGNTLEGSGFHLSKEDIYRLSPPSVLDGSIDDNLYDQLRQTMVQAESSRREAFEEAVRRGKAEKDAIEAIHRAKASENLYSEELKQRKEIEVALAKEKEELEKVKNHLDKITEELRIALEQKLNFESQLAESDQMVKELEGKIISAVELLQSYKKEQDELQVERDNALREAEELGESQQEVSCMHLPQFFTEFSFSEIEDATQNFDPSLKIGEGGYGSIYKGLLRHTLVAIKLLHAHSLQGPSEFQQEVNVLSKMRHPNLITLIGACPEAWTLIYEYLPNGSLEDRLCCKGNSPPLSWQTRIRIATELCSVLVFLHSGKAHSIVHGDLKPANILLDANFVSKLSDFGICRLISHCENLSSNATLFCNTDPKGTFAYIDPEFLATGELTPKSDVYSFGVILLRLLTGRPALGITKEVQYALDTGKLKTLLDPLAGDWPFVQAEQLAHLGLRCCEMNRRSRPDLGTEVLRVLEPMRASCGGSSAFHLGSDGRCQPPSYFICPIFQEVMQDPHIAADGFTYEAEALRGWLDSGHDTSPMTNIKLAHCNIVPNHALRSAIQEWLQQHI